MRRCPVNNGDARNAADRFYCVHQNNKVNHSCLNSKDHGHHQETQGKEILTKGVVLKHITAVATVSEREATCQNFLKFCESDETGQQKKGLLVRVFMFYAVGCSLSPSPSLPPSFHLPPLPHTPPMPTQPTPTPLLPLPPPHPATRPTTTITPTHSSRPRINTTTRRWPRVHIRSNCAFHTSSPLGPSRHSFFSSPDSLFASGGRPELHKMSRELQIRVLKTFFMMMGRRCQESPPSQQAKAFRSPWTGCDRKERDVVRENEKKKECVGDRLKFRNKN